MAAHPPDADYGRKGEELSRSEQSEPMESNLVGYGHDVVVFVRFLKGPGNHNAFCKEYRKIV